jgi:hypothetical protein
MRVAIGFLAALMTSPAAAQFVGKPVYEPVPPPAPFIGTSRSPGPGVARELRDVRSRIERARDEGQLSKREARQLRREARLIGRLADRYAAGGLSPAERGELGTRAQVLRSRIVRAAGTSRKP